MLGNLLECSSFRCTDKGSVFRKEASGVARTLMMAGADQSYESEKDPWLL